MEYTYILQALFTPYHDGPCCINVIQALCCDLGHSCTKVIQCYCCVLGHYYTDEPKPLLHNNIFQQRPYSFCSIVIRGPTVAQRCYSNANWVPLLSNNGVYSCRHKTDKHDQPKGCSSSTLERKKHLKMGTLNAVHQVIHSYVIKTRREGTGCPLHCTASSTLRSVGTSTFLNSTAKRYAPPG